MEKPFKQKENIDDEACTFILSVGSLNFSDTHTHTHNYREKTSEHSPREAKALLAKLVQKRDFTKCKCTKNNTCDSKYPLCS